MRLKQMSNDRIVGSAFYHLHNRAFPYDFRERGQSEFEHPFYIFQLEIHSRLSSTAGNKSSPQAFNCSATATSTSTTGMFK